MKKTIKLKLIFFLPVFFILSMFFIPEAFAGCCKVTTSQVNCRPEPNTTDCYTICRYSGACVYSSNACESFEGCPQYDLGSPELEIVGSSQQIKPVTNIQIGGKNVEFSGANCDGDICEIDWIGKYISVLYRYGVGITAILAVVMVMAGGFFWLISGGSPDKVNKAKEFIFSAITGLTLALFSFLLLYAINPRLVIFDPLRIKDMNSLRAESLTSPAAEASASAGCPSEEQKESGFSAYTTGYCKPARSNYDSDASFLCAVGINCSCPAGRSSSLSCSNSAGKHWAPCLPFDPDTTAYCHETASNSAPEIGTVAADWSCFPKGSQVCIGGNTYTVTDKGGWIKGTRFDIWTGSDCAQTNRVTGNYTVTTGACN